MKFRIRVGDVEVEYEGQEAFVSKKLLGLISQLSQLTGQTPRGEPARSGVKGDPGPLAAYLKAKSAKTIQWKRFLATAEWLHLRGRARLGVRDVTNALKENQQARLGNPSDVLNKNVSKGYCEKKGREFWVTDDGRKALG